MVCISRMVFESFAILIEGITEILSDPAIKRIPWNEITVGPAIGKGASGLVSKGVWVKNGKK
jgi:hypothetical protein